MKLPKTLDYQKFIILSECMFESNHLIFIKTNIWSFWSKEELKRRYTKWEVTITSIEVRLPQFSIGDTVMIVDTGEIGKLLWYDPCDMRRSMTGSEECVLERRLVKIPTDLLTLLQE